MSLLEFARGPALAFALLAQTYNFDVSQRWLSLRGATREQWMQKADKLSEQAFQLDESIFNTFQFIKHGGNCFD